MMEVEPECQKAMTMTKDVEPREEAWMYTEMCYPFTFAVSLLGMDPGKLFGYPSLDYNHNVSYRRHILGREGS